MIIEMTGFPSVESELQRDVEKKWADDVSLLYATLDAADDAAQFEIELWYYTANYSQ